MAKATANAKAKAKPTRKAKPAPKAKPAANKPAANKPAANKPAANKPAANKPAANKPAANKPAANKPAANKPAANKPATAAHAPAATARRPAGPVLRGIRSVIFQVDDLDKAKAFYSAALGRSPYFDQPFYAGYDVDGQELGLHPDLSTQGPGPGGAVAYWKVDDIAKSWQFLLALGARTVEAPHDVGGEIQTATVADPFGNLVGLIQLPG